MIAAAMMGHSICRLQWGMATLKKTLLLTGASRGIGHATVKHFHAAEWRVITVSRQPFDKICPWPQGEKDHVQMDLNDLARCQFGAR